MSYGQISYITPMWNLAKNGFNPERILELGCGCSSYVMRWLWAKSELVVLDDHENWMKLLDNMGGYKIDKKMCEKTKEGFLKQIDSNGTFDFIFVDSGHIYNKSGPWRNDFMKFIRENGILNPGGIVMLHDANREEYQEESNSWKYSLKLKDYATHVLTLDELQYSVEF